MKRIVIAGRDRTEELRPKSGVATNGPAPDLPGLALARSANQAEYLAQLIALLRTHGALRTDIVTVPVPPDLLGRLLKPLRRLQWRMLRYQHDSMAFQQNTINHQVSAALECLRAEYRDDTARLEARIAELEAEVAALRGNQERRL